MGKNERRGWTLVAVLLLIGLLCVISAGNLAIRFAPRWTLQADMRSRINPDSAFYTSQPGYILPPLDPAILTPPIWIDLFLTPGQTFPTRFPKASPTAVTNTTEPTRIPPTVAATASPTSTPIYFLASPTSRPGTTPQPPASASATFTSRPTATGTLVTTSNPPALTITASLPPGNTPLPQADLQITKDNGVLVYSAGGTLNYTVVVSNNGPSDVSGALVLDALQPQLSDWSWICTSQDNGASGCDPVVANAADFSDVVDLPMGASIVYTVNANTRGDAAGSISNTASINPPVSLLDPVPGNNSATDKDDLLNTLPYNEIGTIPNGIFSVLPPGSSLTFAFSTPLVVNGHPGYDLVMYEMPNGSGIAMDFITIQVSDGSRWFTIFNWGDNIADTNSNFNIAAVGGEERDNRGFTTIPESNILYPFNSGTPANPATGVVFELDGVVPDGTYPYFRIVSPVSGDVDGGCEVDAVVILP